MTTLNPAVKEHLRAIVAIERRRTALFMLKSRAAALLVHMFAIVVYGLSMHDRAWLISLPPEILYAAFTLALVWLARSVPRVLYASGFLIAFLDIPAMTAAMLWMLPRDVAPALVLLSTGPVVVALVVGAGLTLNYAAIALANVSACVAMTVVAARMGAPVPQMIGVLTACLGVGVVVMYLVSCIRSLVEQSRRRDLGGKYILGRQLGIGGMAQVFEATYSPAGGFERRVAVKRILPAYAENEQAIEMFRREAQVGAMLTHPNIVQVHDFGCDGAAYFLAMELVDGTSLKRILELLWRSGGRMPLPAFSAMAEMMCSALDYVHTRTDASGAPLSLVHRDVNPPNILISRLGEVKLGDFGVARTSLHESLTLAGEFRGKVSYASPEQLLNHALDRRSDLFALGITFYEALTAQKLFQGESDAQLAMSVAHQKIPRISKLRFDVPAALDDLLAAMLERDVNNRPLSAAAIARRLAQLPAELADASIGRRQLAAMVEAVLADPSLVTPPFARPGAQSQPTDAHVTQALEPVTVPALLVRGAV
jgi:eukaryotic-like serine/threonine-protein kinase